MKKFLLCGVDVGSRELVVAIETGSGRVWEGGHPRNVQTRCQLRWNEILRRKDLTENGVSKGLSFSGWATG